MKKKLVITIIGWVISIALLSSLFAKMNFSALWEGLRKAGWGWLILAAAVNIIVIALKTLRWQWLMEPGINSTPSPPPSPTRGEGEIPVPSPSMGEGQGEGGYWTIFKATMIGLAGNNVLPARGGDWLKIYLLGNWAGSSKASLASVTGLDRLFDGLSILILFWIFSVQTIHIGRHHEAFPGWVKDGTVIMTIVLGVSLVICYCLLFHHRRTNNVERLGRIGKIIKNLGMGMEVLAKHHVVAGTIIVSFASTLLQIVTLWACQKAFGMTLEPVIPAVVFIAINLAIIIPSAPSGVGPFEAAAVLAYRWVGLKTETAFNIALMYHAVQFFPVTITGLLFYLKTYKKQINIATANSM